MQLHPFQLLYSHAEPGVDLVQLLRRTAGVSLSAIRQLCGVCYLPTCVLVVEDTEEPHEH